MATEQLERSPFGRRLSLLIHKLPKQAANVLDWELDRGFHLVVLGENLFELKLRPRHGDAAPVNPLNLVPSSTSAMTRILLWQRSSKDENWEEFAQLLSSEPWEAGLILSSQTERAPWSPLGPYFRRRRHWAKTPCPVVQIFQDTPPCQFFTVEKNLFVLGRAGRRLERLLKIRRWLPW